MFSKSLPDVAISTELILYVSSGQFSSSLSLVSRFRQLSSTFVNVVLISYGSSGQFSSPIS